VLSTCSPCLWFLQRLFWASEIRRRAAADMCRRSGAAYVDPPTPFVPFKSLRAARAASNCSTSVCARSFSFLNCLTSPVRFIVSPRAKIVAKPQTPNAAVEKFLVDVQSRHAGSCRQRYWGSILSILLLHDQLREFSINSSAVAAQCTGPEKATAICWTILSVPGSRSGCGSEPSPNRYVYPCVALGMDEALHGIRVQ
jgi:hypothetical protein